MMTVSYFSSKIGMYLICDNIIAFEIFILVFIVLPDPLRLIVGLMFMSNEFANKSYRSINRDYFQELFRLFSL